MSISLIRSSAIVLSLIVAAMLGTALGAPSDEELRAIIRALNSHEPHPNLEASMIETLPVLDQLVEDDPSAVIRMLDLAEEEKQEGAAIRIAMLTTQIAEQKLMRASPIPIVRRLRLVSAYARAVPKENREVAQDYLLRLRSELGFHNVTTFKQIYAEHLRNHGRHFSSAEMLDVFIVLGLSADWVQLALSEHYQIAKPQLVAAVDSVIWKNENPAVVSVSLRSLGKLRLPLLALLAQGNDVYLTFFVAEIQKGFIRHEIDLNDVRKILNFYIVNFEDLIDLPQDRRHGWNNEELTRFIKTGRAAPVTPLLVSGGNGERFQRLKDVLSTRVKKIQAPVHLPKANSPIEIDPSNFSAVEELLKKDPARFLEWAQQNQVLEFPAIGRILCDLVETDPLILAIASRLPKVRRGLSAIDHAKLVTLSNEKLRDRAKTQPAKFSKTMSSELVSTLSNVDIEDLIGVAASEYSLPMLSVVLNHDRIREKLGEEKALLLLDKLVQIFPSAENQLDPQVREKIRAVKNVCMENKPSQ